MVVFVRRARAGLGAIVALLVVGLGLQATDAHAQAMDELPAVRSSYDANGVDLISLRARFVGPSISVGVPGAGGLSFQQNYTEVESYFPTWAHPYSTFAQLYTSTGVVTVVFDGRTETFDMSSSTTDVPSEQATGSFLTLDSGASEYKYRHASGDLMAFSSVTGDLQYIQHANGERITPVYNGNRRLQSVINNFGYQIKFDYASSADPMDWEYWSMVKATAINNAVDYCDPAADACSGLTQAWPSLTYAQSGSSPNTTWTITDNMARVTTVYTDVYGLTSVVTPAQTITYARFIYPNNYKIHDIASVTRGSDVWTYSSGTAGGYAYKQAVDPEGRARTITRNVDKQITRDTDAAGLLTTYSYTGGLLTGAAYPGGQSVAYAYDGRDNLTSTTITPATGSATTTYISYESSCTSGNILYCNKPKTTTDALGNVTDYSYDAAHGGLLAVTLPSPGGGAARPEVRTSYTGLNAYVKNSGGSFVATSGTIYLPTVVKTCTTGAGSSCANAANEIVTTTAYGSTGVANNLLPTSVTTRDGTSSVSATVAMTYNAVGQPLTVDGPLSGADDTAHYRYDAYWRLVGMVGPDPDGGGSLKPQASRTTLNSLDQPTVVETGTVNAASDSPWDTNFTVLTKVETAYDARNRPITRTLKNPAGTRLAVSQASYNAVGQVVCAASRLNSADFASPPAACTQGTGGADRITQTAYDSAGRTSTVTDGVGTALSQTTQGLTYLTSGYGIGQLATLTDANGNRTTYDYDGFGRSWKVFYPHPSTTGTSSTTDYEQYSYDANGNLTTLRLRDATSVSYTWDNLDRQTVGMQGATYAYDNLGRVTSTTKSSATASYTYDAFDNQLSETTALGTVSYQYDVAGRRTRLTWPDSVYVTYDWDTASNLAAIKLSGSTTLAAFAYDSHGRRTGLTRGNGTSTSYSYDDRSLLSGLTLDLASTGADQTASFTRDLAGRITGKSGSNNAYDMASPSSAATVNTSPNGLNQIASWTHDGRGNATVIGSSTYSYDIANRLTGRTSGSAVTLSYDPVGRLYEHAGSAATRFQYDGADMVTEFNTSGTVLRRYVHGPGSDEPLVWFEGSNTATPKYLHADERGSIVGVSDGSGAALALDAYDEYGRTASTSTGRFGYTGQAWFADLGLYYYKARFYAPEHGRFLQTDPIGYGDGMNLYAYVGNDPINGVDPTGTEVVCTIEINYDPTLTEVDGEQVYTATNITRTTNCEVVPDPWDFGGLSPTDSIGGGGGVGFYGWNTTQAGTAHRPVRQPPATRNLAEKDLNCELLPSFQSIYHKFDGECGNVKFVCDEGHVEGVYGKGGQLVTNPNNVGTYNKYGPNYIFGVPHFLFDVIPYYAKGNPGGTTPLGDRLRGAQCPIN